MKTFLLWLLEQTAEEVTGRSGQKAPVSGLYREGSEFICLTKDERFPPRVGEWRLVVSV